ncbi:MAG: hypothetical protein EHM34_04250 [Nitrosopumilales archaeon]|nr:MAG: hypothetical protein EHM34_04250 [Nitrosopumilales archaeon]
MDIREFKKKYKDLIKKGAVRFTTEHPYTENYLNAQDNLTDFQKKLITDILRCQYITIDRYNLETGEFLCEARELKPVRTDVLKMGYEKHIGLGVYRLNQKFNMETYHNFGKANEES